MDESTNDKDMVSAFDREISPADPEFPIYLFVKNVQPDSEREHISGTT